MARAAKCRCAARCSASPHALPALHCLCLAPGLSVSGILAAVLGPRAVRSLYRRRRTRRQAAPLRNDGEEVERRLTCGGWLVCEGRSAGATAIGVYAWCDCDRRRGREVSTCPQRHAARHCASSSVCRGRGAFRLFYCAGVQKGAVAGGLPTRVTVVRRRVPFLKGVVDSVTD